MADVSVYPLTFQSMKLYADYVRHNECLQGSPQYFIRPVTFFVCLAHAPLALAEGIARFVIGIFLSPFAYFNVPYVKESYQSQFSITDKNSVVYCALIDSGKLFILAFRQFYEDKLIRYTPPPPTPPLPQASATTAAGSGFRSTRIPEERPPVAGSASARSAPDSRQGPPVESPGKPPTGAYVGGRRVSRAEREGHLADRLRALHPQRARSLSPASSKFSSVRDAFAAQEQRRASVSDASSARNNHGGKGSASTHT